MLAFWMYFAILVTILLLVWSFYLIAKIHIYKFREYSTHVRPVTRFVGLVLLVMTIIGFVVVFRELNAIPAQRTTVQDQSITETY
ncbi:MAG: hypothetical protein PHU93_04820 [Candidatus Gracilibacteria bacterium]|nr:hypothetical protein [Candidatus Gracilibacteria bacterium]